MGLIGDNCVTCRAAAKNDKGLAGGWWRFWAEVRRDLEPHAYRTCAGADSSGMTATTGKRPLGLYWRWHRRKFCVGCWRVVRGTVGLLQMEKGETISFSFILFPVSPDRVVNDDAWCCSDCISAYPIRAA